MSYIKTTIRVQPVDTVACEILIAWLSELGDASLLKTKSSYNIILANINRNILMEDMPHYNHALKNNGYVLLSGFYKEDFEKIDNIARSLKWKHLLTKEQNNWVAVSYRKK
ncbi:MAG: ribosomal protein methyltransferase [Anaerophaga sp.]|uniref:50S ribosomal protein L11 methyltransferase n=1 Tax=Anaerophaga thermohalophila TaxID=177400 RepID=UPI000237BB14|nr:50S ribosomal protein L11 methyltransferase [Anaerophaga thermohalophila]MDI3520946.1 ribosomal protein methyltransferase [Anaerophaga sp.]MDK2842073.1 ribosomal protein methyltransferase [Anaerophaga sp.]MDN5291533.1 ribosomal protein methyltransferase [Anaerophaga sp.]